MSSKNNSLDRPVRLDCHVDTLLRILLEAEASAFDFGDNPETKERVLKTQAAVTADRLRAGAMDGCFFAAFTADQGNTETSNDVIARMLQLLHRDLNRMPGYEAMKVASTAEEIRSAARADIPLAIPCIEGGYGIEEDNYVRLIEQYRDLGVRYITLVWNNNNHLGSGTNADVLPTDITDDKPEPKIGLTDLGARVIAVMEEHGILVDVSHMDDLTLDGTLNAARKPLIATHSNSDFINRDRRNLDDDQLRAIAATGGVVALSSCNRFINIDKPKADMPQFMNHFDHVRKTIGIAHMGFGSDFDGAGMIPELKDISHMEALRTALAGRDFSPSEIDQILGANVFRLLAEADLTPRSLAQVAHDVLRSFDFRISDAQQGACCGEAGQTPSGGVLALPLCEAVARHFDDAADEPYVAVINGVTLPAKRTESELVAPIPEQLASRLRGHALFVSFVRGQRRITGVTEYGKLMKLSM